MQEYKKIYQEFCSSIPRYFDEIFPFYVHPTFVDACTFYVTLGYESKFEKDVKNFVIYQFYSDSAFIDDPSSYAPYTSLRAYHNLIGQAEIEVDPKSEALTLHHIDISEHFYDQGFGTKLLKQTIKEVERNPVVNPKGKYKFMEGMFFPYKLRSQQKVYNFYVRNGADVEALDNGVVRFELEPEIQK